MITKRPMRGLDPRDKIFLAFEGTRTEPQYFEGLIEKEEKNINAEIIPLYRGPGREFNSNPKKLTEMVYDYVRWRYHDEYSVDLFIELILHSVSGRMGMEPDGKLFKKIKDALIHSPSCTADRKKIDDPIEALEICRPFFDDNIDIPSHPPVGERGDARFFIIADRDPDSFIEEQCRCVCDICKENEFKLVISNPCFEVWLLLHFDVGREEMLRHVSPKGLKDLLMEKSGQEHGHLDYEAYHDNIESAIDRLKDGGYCEDLEKLLFSPGSVGTIEGHNIGTNMVILIDSIFKYRY